MKLRFVESVYRGPKQFADKNVQWFWVGRGGYGKGFWRPDEEFGQLTNEQIFELLRKYL